MIDFGLPYTVDWKVFSVNEDTWDDSEELADVLSVTVDRDCTDAVPLLETANMVVYTSLDDPFDDGWYRVVANVTQNGRCERFPITTQLFQASSDEIDYGVAKNNVSGVSVLASARDVSVQTGSYVPKGANGADWVVDQLQQCIQAPVYLIGDGFTLDQYVVYDAGDTVLSTCWSVLDIGRWCLQIAGDGSVYVMARPNEPDIELGISTLRYLSPNMKRSGRSLINMPNRYRASDYDKTESVENHDESSPVSYENVGRWIDAPLDTNPEYINGESLWSYVRRRLEEESTLIRTYDYNREYWPGALPFSIIRASDYESGFVGDLRITKQKLTLDGGIQVSETANEEIKLWRA